jgi:hypothetical protein
MGKSILQDKRECYFCGKLTDLSVHHVFAGVANRPISEKYGLKVYLCQNCHTGTDGAQYDKTKNRQLKQDAQFAFEREHSRSEWMKLIGKNYL